MSEASRMTAFRDFQRTHRLVKVVVRRPIGAHGFTLRVRKKWVKL